MRPFQERLHEIRVNEETRARHRRRPTDEELGLLDGSEQYEQIREELAQVIEACMEDCRREEASFSLRRGLYAGKYAITLSGTLSGGTPAGGATDEFNERGPVKEFSRLTFLLSSNTERPRFELECKITVRNRDLPTSRAKGSVLEPDDVQRLKDFAEAEVLRFARQYFARSAVAVG